MIIKLYSIQWFINLKPGLDSGDEKKNVKTLLRKIWIYPYGLVWYFLLLLIWMSGLAYIYLN